MQNGKFLNPYCKRYYQPRSRLDRLTGPLRDIFNGILYQLKNGCNWQDLPKDLPPYSTVYWHLHSVANRWGIRGTDECLT
ncbi:MAG: transposase [Nostoc sp. NMS7]|uniref:transposase n=1 Tax=Nostoc sp. NMS7 TaxID=2815391 RepID=UPI0034581244|nr:transposase [Nostoc sp. NMS7]